MAEFGDVVTKLSLDKKQFETGLVSASRELGKVRKDINLASQQAAQGDQQAYLRLVSLVAQEEHLGLTAKRAADIEMRARHQVLGTRAQEIAQIKTQELAEKSLTATVQQRSMIQSRGGGARGMGGTGIAFGLQDAVAGYQYGGAQGVANSISNNLPQIGMEVSMMASRFAKAGSLVGRAAGGIARFAGPIGLLASVVLPVATAGFKKLYNSLTENARVADGLSGRLEKTRAERAKSDQLSDLRKGEGGTLETVRKDAKELQKELDAVVLTHRALVLEVSGRAARDAFQSETQEGDLRKQIVESEKMMRDLNARIAAARGLESEGAAARRNKEREKREAEQEQREGVSALNNRLDFDAKHRMFRRQAEEKENAERLRIENVADSSMGRSVMAGLSGGLSRIQRQRESIMRGGTSFERPETVSRESSMDKIIAMRGDKAERAAEKHRTEQLKKLDNQQKTLEQIRDAVRNQMPGRPARV